MLVILVCFVANADARGVQPFRSTQSICNGNDRLEFYNNGTFRLFVGGVSRGEGTFSLNNNNRTITLSMQNGLGETLTLLLTNVTVQNGRLLSGDFQGQRFFSAHCR